MLSQHHWLLYNCNNSMLLPRRYLVLCRAKDSYAQLASNWRLVQVQQQYAVTFTLPLTLPAATLAAAQAQADILTATSNATAALADAVSAGIISGQLLCLVLACC